MIGIITVVLIAVIGIWVKRQYFSAENIVKEFAHGPFVIRMESFTTSDFNMNYGRFTKHTNIAYTVLHNGKAVEFPSELQSNTGFSHLWRVYILQDAPTPTLVAGSQSLFMITAKGDSYEVKPMYIQSSDFIKFQWLDAINGQPGPAFELFMGDGRTSMEHPDTLKGGNYLMISKKHVLFVPTMEQFHFNVDNMKMVDNYDKDGDALAFSPDEKVIVFPGHFQTWNSQERPKYHNALMSYDFRKDEVRALPYSKNDTRLYRPENVNYNWFNTHFIWDTSGNETVLKYNKPEKLALWQGYFNESSFYLYPADSIMVEVLKQFILDYMKWTPKAVLTEKYHEYTGRVFQLGIEKPIFYLVGNEDEVHLAPDLYEKTEDSTLVLIKKIGLAFNEVLKTGKYQEHFTGIPEHDEY